MTSPIKLKLLVKYFLIRQQLKLKGLILTIFIVPLFKLNIIQQKNMKTYQIAIKGVKNIFVLLLMAPVVLLAQVLSANGTSGIGILPDATVIPSSSATISFDRTLPGAANPKGYNTQIGLGLYDGLELVGRLATNDQRCNMFQAGACPANTIRDFSASLKWSLQLEWLKQNNAHLALGVTDVGDLNLLRRLLRVLVQPI